VEKPRRIRAESGLNEHLGRHKNATGPERIRRRTYLTRNAVRQDVFDYIEMFYNPTRKHTNNGMLSPVDYEMKQKKMNEAGV